MSIFSASAPCGIFAPSTDPDCAEGFWKTLVFHRDAHLAAGVAPPQTPAGEILLHFVPLGAWTLFYTPRTGTALGRFLPGMVVRDGGTGVYFGYAGLLEADRTYVDRSHMEIVAVRHMGSVTTEIDLAYVGR